MPLPLTLVPDEIAAEVIEAAVKPYLARFEKERKVGIAVDFEQWTETSARTLPAVEAAPGKGRAVHRALGRVLFRSNHGGDVYNFRAAVRWGPETVAPGTGCTGFNVNGWIRHLEAPPQVETRGWGVLYNDPELPVSF